MLKRLSATNLILLTLLILVTTCSTLFAQAGYENWGRPYISGTAGISLVDDISLMGDTGSSFGGLGVLLENGLAVSGAVGQYYGPGRAEIEFLHRDHDIDRIDIPFSHDFDVSGRVRSQGVMVNLLYDFDRHRRLNRVCGYVGGGLGFAHIKANATATDGTRLEGSDTVLAYQFLAGIQNKIARKLTVFGGYRAFITSDPRIGMFRLDTKISHSLEMGLRFDF